MSDHVNGRFGFELFERVSGLVVFVHDDPGAFEQDASAFG